MENTIFSGSGGPPICISLGILVWNEEEAIGPALQSVFRQSLFSELRFRRLGCEIMCVANGCTDRTAAIATNIFREQSQTHAFKSAFSCCTVELPERGKINAWNMFIHSLSAKPARVLFLMDGDIVLQDPETLWNMDSKETNRAARQFLTAIYPMSKTCSDSLSPWRITS